MSRYIIDKKALDENIEYIKQKANVPIIGVVKGNGYGFGIKELSKILSEHNIETFGITEIDDIDDVRDAVKDKDIFVMRSTCNKDEAKKVASNNCIATIGSLKSAQTMSEISKELNVTTRCYLKIDTGLGRYGFLPSQVEDAKKCYSFDNLEFIGAYTHFSSAFTNSELTKAQLTVFKDTMNVIKDSGIDVGVLHASNSPALLNVNDVSLDMVRIGSAFTGRVITKSKTPLKRIGYLEAEVIEVKTVPSGYSIGYNGLFKTKRETKVAIVPIGHYDGFGITKEKEVADFHSVLSQLKKFVKKEQLYIKINGRMYPVIGEIGLSHTALDVTGSDVKENDIATADISPLMVNPKIKRIYK